MRRGARSVLWRSCGRCRLACAPNRFRAAGRDRDRVDGSARVLARGRAVRLEVADRSSGRNRRAGSRRADRVGLSEVRGDFRVAGSGRFLAHVDSIEPPPVGPGCESAIWLPCCARCGIRPAGTTLQGSAAMRGASTLECGPTVRRACGSPRRRCACAGDRWGPVALQGPPDRRRRHRAVRSADTRCGLRAARDLATAGERSVPVGTCWRPGRTADRPRRPVSSVGSIWIPSRLCCAPSRRCQAWTRTGRALVRIARSQLGFAPDRVSAVRAIGPGGAPDESRHLLKHIARLSRIHVRVCISLEQEPLHGPSSRAAALTAFTKPS